MGCGRSGTSERTAGGFGPPGSIQNNSPIGVIGGGDGGTITIGAGRYVSSLWCIGSGTIALTPSGPNEKLPCTGAKADAGWFVLDGGHTADASPISVDGGAC